jgi:hypothetical protein
VLNIVHKKEKKSEKSPFKINYLPFVLDSWSIQCVFLPRRESIRRSLRKFRKNKNKEDKDIQIQKEEEDTEGRSRKASYELSISYSQEDIHNIETQSIGGQSRRKVKIFLILIFSSLLSFFNVNVLLGLLCYNWDVFEVHITALHVQTVRIGLPKTGEISIRKITNFVETRKWLAHRTVGIRLIYSSKITGAFLHQKVGGFFH